MDALAFNPLSIPYLVVTLLTLTTGLLALLIRGDTLLRVAVFTVSAAVMPWAIGSFVTANMSDPELIEPIFRLYVACVSLIGPAMLLLVLAVSGLVEHHRLLLAISIITAAASCVVAATTELATAGVWQTPSGVYFVEAGPLLDVHVGQFVAWTVVGAMLGQHSGKERTERGRLNRRFVIVFVLLASVGASDLLLAHGVGVYPFSSISATISLSVLVYAIARQDLLRARGFDAASAFELVALAGLAAAVLGLAWVAPEYEGMTGPVATIALFLPLLMITQGVMAWVRKRQRSHAEVNPEVVADDRALDTFIEICAKVRDHDALRSALVELVKTQLLFARVRLYLTDEHGWVAVGHESDAPVRVDARVRAWLIANPTPLIEEELRTRRLGGLREPIESFLGHLDADIVVPLVNRGQLVGGIATEAPATRAVREDERRILGGAANATAAAITYIELLRDAEEKVEVAREIEVAAAVQHAQAPGITRVSHDGMSIVSHYEPASRFGGDWWASYQLPDGRVLVTIGDVTGHGVPAALISGTVLGACETAQQMMGAGFDVLGFLQLLNESVAEVGGARYAMSCFAAVFDLDDRRVTFANAAHPFPYVCSPPTGDGDKARLRALVSRGTPLGTRQPVLAAKTESFAPGDLLVFYSDSLVDSRNPEGEPFGDRRLQRLLRKRAWRAGDGACELIVDHAHAHYGGRHIDDDIALVVARVAG